MSNTAHAKHTNRGQGHCITKETAVVLLYTPFIPQLFLYFRYGGTVATLSWIVVNNALVNQVGVVHILSLMDLILSMPPTSVFNERSFSHMKLIKGGVYIKYIDFVSVVITFYFS